MERSKKFRMFSAAVQAGWESPPPFEEGAEADHVRDVDSGTDVGGSGYASPSPSSPSTSFDATDALFQRGLLLSKLRALEKEDEELRRQGRESDETRGQESQTDTLYYAEYLSNQRLYDDYKHVNFHYVEFEMNQGETKPLTIQQDRHVGKGGLVWDAAFILAETVTRGVMATTSTSVFNTTWWNRKCRTIVELGSGTGACGLLVASALPTCQVHLTDLPQLQPLLETNVKANTPENVTWGVLEWGEKLPSSTTDGESSATKTYDLVLGSDVVASIYDSTGLARTIYNLCHDRSQVYLACRERLAGCIDRFETYLREHFDCVDRRAPDSDNKTPGVLILYATGKRPTMQ